MLKKNYFNLKKEEPNIKGEVGEVICRRLIHYSHRPREITFQTFVRKLPFEIPHKMKTFLERFWYTIDLFRFETTNDKITQLIIYEIKTCSFYPDLSKVRNPYAPLTSRTFDMITEAQKNKFDVKYAKVMFFDDWRVGVKILEFDLRHFYIQSQGNFGLSKEEKRNNEIMNEFKTPSLEE